MIRIESRQNAALRHLARLGRERKYRRSTGEMLCEGEKMLAEAAASGARVTTLLVREGEAGRLPPDLLAYAERTGAALYCAPEALFRQASEVETPQRVIFSCAQPQWTADALAGKKQVLLLDGLQDPGNLGTILRTAEAFALGAVVLCEGCADPFSPKVVRSTMGAVLRMPFLYVDDLPGTISGLKEAGIKVYAAHLKGELAYDQEDYRTGSAFLIGNEGNGLRDEVAECADHYVIIPMQGKAESLNAAVAAALLMFEAGRQRRS